MIKKLYTDNYNHHQKITGFGRDPRRTGGIDKVYYNKLKRYLSAGQTCTTKFKIVVRYVMVSVLLYTNLFILFMNHLQSVCLFLDSTTILSEWTIHFIHTGHAKQNYAHYGSA